MDDQHNLTTSQEESRKLVLRESKKHQEELDGLIGIALALQKLYGRGVENTGQVITLFHRMLAQYPGEKAVKAFQVWLERSQEFPTPADIIGLIKRNGKPPIRESDIIAINKKDGADRTRAEWKMLREYEEQQQDGWEENEDKQQFTLQENLRLRDEIAKLQAENRKLSIMIRSEISKPIPQIKLPDKIERNCTL